MRIAILVVHHTHKCYDSDPFNMVSGSTGIIGSVDGIRKALPELKMRIEKLKEMSNATDRFICDSQRADRQDSCS